MYLLDREKDRERLRFLSLDRDRYLRLSLERDLNGRRQKTFQSQEMFIPQIIYNGAYLLRLRLRLLLLGDLQMSVR